VRERNPPRGVDFIAQVLCVYPTGEISLHRSCTHAHIHMRAGPVLFCIRVCLCVCVKHMKCTARTFCLPTFQVLVTRDEEKRVRRDLSLTKINGMMAATPSCSSVSSQFFVNRLSFQTTSPIHMQAVRRSAGCQRNDTMHRYYRARDPGNCCCCVPRMPEIPFRLPTPRLFSLLDPLGVKNSFMIYMNGCSVFKCIQTYSCLFPRVKFESDNYQNPALCVKRARDRARERDRLRGARESARLHVLLGTVLTDASLFSHLLIVNKLLSLSLSLSLRC